MIGFPGSSAGIESGCNAGDPGSVPGLERFPQKRDRLPILVFLGFPNGSDGKESACSVGDLCLISGLGRSPGDRLVNPLQYSCLENPPGQRSLVDHSPWGHKELDMTEQLITAQHSLCHVTAVAVIAFTVRWTVTVSVCVKFTRPMSSHLFKHLSRCCCEGIYKK